MCKGLDWGKNLISYVIGGKVLNVMKDIHLKAKSCVKTQHGLSSFFTCNVGVQKGENVSPVLFLLFLNDYKKFFLSMLMDLYFLKLYQMNMIFAILVIICTYFCFWLLMILLYMLKMPVICRKHLMLEMFIAKNMVLN